MIKGILIICGAAVLSTTGFSQPQPAVPAGTLSKTDTGGLKKAQAGTLAPLPYNQVITADAVSAKGLFTIHKVKERYYFEIPVTLMEKPLLVVSRIAKAPSGIERGYFGFAGDELAENEICFSKGPTHKLFMKQLYYTESAIDSSVNGLFRSLSNNTIQPIRAAFDIKAYSRDSSSVVVDMTDYIAGDHEIITGVIKKGLSVQALQPDKSYIGSIRSFPLNVEIQTTKTYMRGNGGDDNRTVEINTSVIMLPATLMQKRFADERVGFFSNDYIDFDAHPQRVTKTAVILRWRLEPRAEDLEKYKRGELVEPAKPIVFYIDPATPRKWVPYLIQGVNDWQAAFERAGFKNAILAREAPEGDSSWSLEDARHNAIVYKPSRMANAMGPCIFDPRTGEILEAHVGWFHNVMTIIHDWYMMQAGAVDPAARKMELDDTLMGKLIRFVSSHEIGHTLGLAHNFGSSSTVPVDSLRNKKWVEAYGHTPSIMDYARFNYVAQPEDSIGETGLLPRIGDYDKWAIEWGYRLWPDAKSSEEERTVLNKMTTDSLRCNPRLFFGAQTTDYVLDPRSQSEDLGDNAVKASAWGIKNLKRVMPLLPRWTSMPGELYSTGSGSSLSRMLNAGIVQYLTWCNHVVNTIGSIYYTPRAEAEKGQVFAPVPKTRQQEAMAFLQSEVFINAPEWLVSKEVADKTIAPAYQHVSEQVGKNILRSLLTLTRLKNIDAAEKRYGAAQTYSLTAFFDDLNKGIWPELLANKPSDNYHVSLQELYISLLQEIIDSKNEPGLENIISVARGNLQDIGSLLKKCLSRTQVKMTRYHYLGLIARIDELLDPARAPMPAAGGAKGNTAP